MLHLRKNLICNAAEIGTIRAGRSEEEISGLKCADIACFRSNIINSRFMYFEMLANGKRGERNG